MKAKLLFLLLIFPILSYSQLSGYWKTNTGGCYQITQKGNNVYWSAESGSSKRAKNVFNGKLTGTKLSGVWCDMPSHTRKNCNEKIVLRLEDDNRMVKISSTKSYRGDTWSKLKGNCESGTISSGNSNNLNRCFEKYSGYKIKDWNKKTLNKSLEECADACLGYDWCKSFDYRYSNKKCYLSVKNKDDNVKLVSDNGIDYYHNICWKGVGNNDSKSENLFVPATKKKGVSSKMTLQNGKKYTIEISGTFSVYPKKENNMDALYDWKSKKRKYRSSLLINGKKLSKLIDATNKSKSYKSNHTYSVIITGKGGKALFRIYDWGKYSNNSGGLNIRILDY